MKVTKYYLTPLERIRSMGYAMKIRKKLERELGGIKATEEQKQEAKESWEKIKKMYR